MRRSKYEQAQSYYDSLLQQGYNVDQAKVYTQNITPDLRLLEQLRNSACVPAALLKPHNNHLPVINGCYDESTKSTKSTNDDATTGSTRPIPAKSIRPIIVNNNNQQMMGMNGMMRGKPTSTGYLFWCGCLCSWRSAQILLQQTNFGIDIPLHIWFVWFWPTLRSVGHARTSKSCLVFILHDDRISYDFVPVVNDCSFLTL